MYTTHSPETCLNYAVHPGEVIEEILEAKEMSAAELSRRSGLSAKLISQMLQGKSPVTAETAIKLESVLDISANLLSNMNARYEVFIARQNAVQRRSEQVTESAILWLKAFPYKELIERKCIPDVKNYSELISELTSFFGVGSIESWEKQYGKMAVQFRHSPTFTSSREAMTSWLRIAEKRAEDILCEPFNPDTFRSALKDIRELTRTDPGRFEPILKEGCRRSGVAIVFVPEFTGTHLSGAAWWISPEKAIIALSLRHKRDDHFWFSFFHEAGHILLHGKKPVFIDDKNFDTPEENEANSFAADTLIPVGEYREFCAKTRRFTQSAIQEFAKGVNIAPGIVVGRLQRERRVSFEHLNGLKRKFELVENLGR